MGPRCSCSDTRLITSPPLADPFHELLRIVYLHQDRRAASAGRQEHKSRPVCPIHPNGPVGNLKPTGMIVSVCEPIGSFGWLPLGVGADVHNSYAAEVDIGGVHGYRVEAVVDGERVRGQRQFGWTRRIRQRKTGETDTGYSHNRAGYPDPYADGLRLLWCRALPSDLPLGGLGYSHYAANRSKKSRDIAGADYDRFLAGHNDDGMAAIGDIPCAFAEPGCLE